MIVAGIDYSMTSPAICVGEVDAPYDELKFFAFGKKKMQGIHYDQITICEYPKWVVAQERYNALSNWAIQIIKDYDVQMVSMEGYSFGSKGKVFNLAENMGLLKHRLWELDIPFIEVPPTQAKKFATGKGNADKEAMFNSFVDRTGVDLKVALDDTTKGIGNPISDLIDAYYMRRYLTAGLKLGEFDGITDDE